MTATVAQNANTIDAIMDTSRTWLTPDACNVYLQAKTGRILHRRTILSYAAAGCFSKGGFRTGLIDKLTFMKWVSSGCIPPAPKK